MRNFMAVCEHYIWKDHYKRYKANIRYLYNVYETDIIEIVSINNPLLYHSVLNLEI